MNGYRLGIDLGSTSLGWCALNLNNGEPVGILDMGVRIFDDGRDDKTKTPLAVERRDKRSQRRRRDRLLRRKRKLMEALVKFGLMPSMEVDRKKLEILDPYLLRVKALGHPLQPFEIGRAIFHLGQRRGFKSNRKDLAKSKESGALSEAIERTNAVLKQKQARTLAEYLVIHAGESTDGLINPMRFKSTAIGTKVAWDIYPSRQMVEEEFKTIWEKQKSLSTLLTDTAYLEIHHTIFDQGKLQTPERGKCWLTGDVRAYKALPSFQIFRALQDLNHLEIRRAYASEPGLTKEQKQKIRDLLLQGDITAKGELSFDKLRKSLKLSSTTLFNLESPARKAIKGDLTTKLLANEKCFGALWFQMSSSEKDGIAEKLLNLDDEDSENVFSNWVCEKYKVSLEKVQNIIDQAGKLEPGTGSISQKALYLIIPHLEEGMTFDKACTGAHTQTRLDGTEPSLPYYGKILYDSVLPAPKAQDPNEKAYGRINNPTVHIGLNQLRKLVNRLIEVYGKPEEIHIELARDLPLSAMEKNKLLKGQENNKKENDRIDEELKKAGCTPSFELRLKYRLWEELEPMGRLCPFSFPGKAISLSDALSDKTEVEHLIPFSVSYDDGRSNKVLCLREANRLKGSKTPYEAFGETDAWPEIYARASILPPQKSWRFEPDALARFKDEEGDMIARQLHDTQYLSRVAKRYLSAICPDNKIVSTRGRITATMRRAWGLNLRYLLHESAENIKSRDDHRHHAIDAFVTACVSRSLLKSLSDQAKRSNLHMQRLSEIVPPPFTDWERNKKDLVTFLRKLIVSHKPDHGNASFAIKNKSTTGMLHKDTAYGIVSHDKEKDIFILVTTMRIEDLKLPKPNKEQKNNKKTPIQPKSKYSFDEIRDLRVRSQIEELAETSADDKEFKQKVKDFAEIKNIQSIRVTEEVDGGKIVIVKDKLGKDYKAYRKGSNYCGDIIEVLHGKDKGKWLLYVTPTFDAHQPNFTPSWRNRNEHPTAKLKWRLFVNDMIAFERENKPEIARIQLWSQDLNYLFYVPHNISKLEKRIQINPKEFQKCHGRKISVDILGHVRDPLMTIQSHAANR